jgi:hypothetical protein
MRSTAILGVLVALLLTSTAWSAMAQPADSSHPSPASVELTPAISLFPGNRILGLGMRVAGGNGRRFVEGGVDWTDALNSKHFADQITWFYFWQMKHTLTTNETSRVFVSYGTAGWLERQTVPPGRLKSSIVPPILPSVGLGWQSTAGKHVSLRIDGQVLFWPFEGAFAIPHVNIGVVFPIWTSMGRLSHRVVRD